MITTTEDLSQACQEARIAGAVGIDTEFVWNRTYYPTLGVVQMGYAGKKPVLIDALAVDDWSPFAKLMADAKTVKIFHDAQQDLKILKRACGASPKNIFDTQRCAGFVGLSATISLRDLLKSLMNIRLEKTETQSDWLARPLTDAQLVYAADDVVHSTELMKRIYEKADALGRREWILNEMDYYEQDSLYEESDPETEMPRVRGSGALTHQQRNVLRCLGAWREHSARRRNLPRNFILSDDAIVSLTKRLPDCAQSIRPMKGLTEKTLERNRSKIWTAIERGMCGDLPDLPNGNLRAASCDDGYEARVDFALAYIKGTCTASKVDSALIGNRSEITSLVLGAPDLNPQNHRILRGWRAEFCGHSLLELLSGKGSLSIDPSSKLPRQTN